MWYRPLTYCTPPSFSQRPLVHLRLVNIGIEKLLAQIPSMDSAQLKALLDASFEYIDIPELRAVPLEVLKYLKTIPSEFLKRLVSNPELMSFLPINVQHQVRGRRQSMLLWWVTSN